ncbi:MAG: hypothetical protein JO071_10855 [Deltaproteobacteria bacterium]|nr:hypothetical protein [Deltaproteobacteria bacterium]
MLKLQGRASKLLAVLGGAGLAFSICATRASAASKPPPWANANYANRYICNLTSTTFNTATKQTNFYTGVSKINPNGSGRYTAGSLFAAISPFGGFNPNSTAPFNFCSYTLGTANSGYTVTSEGIGTEIQSWFADSTNNKLCPGNFIMTTTIVLRNNTTGNNVVPRTDFTADNFLGQHTATIHDPGSGYCLK